MESPPTQARRSGLNLPAGMSGTSLRLDTFSCSSRSISNLSSSSPSSCKSSSTCSDRFIPCRSSSRLYAFGLIDKPSPVKDNNNNSNNNNNNNDAYSRLLKSELFGSDFASPSSPAGHGSSSSPTIMSPSKNMLRFKTDLSGPTSPFSPSVLGHHSSFSSDTSTPPKPPRKVPKTPHKASSILLLPHPQKVVFLFKLNYTDFF